jgi:hypothetical protein
MCSGVLVACPSPEVLRRVVVVDDVLSEAALAWARQYLQEATIWYAAGSTICIFLFVWFLSACVIRCRAYHFCVYYLEATRLPLPC